jgi:hypothetical protein
VESLKTYSVSEKGTNHEKGTETVLFDGRIFAWNLRRRARELTEMVDHLHTAENTVQVILN